MLVDDGVVWDDCDDIGVIWGLTCVLFFEREGHLTQSVLRNFLVRPLYDCDEKQAHGKCSSSSREDDHLHTVATCLSWLSKFVDSYQVSCTCALT